MSISSASFCMAFTVAASSMPGAVAALSVTQANAVVLKHNQLRAGMGATNMMMLSWSQALATRAQQHSSTCPGSTHTSRAILGNDGENMAQSASSSFVLTDTTDLTGSVQSWYDEISDAGSYSNGGTFNGFGPCTGTCGHYTQVVWADANEIGCGVSSCSLSNLPGYQLTCQYRSTLSGKYGGNMGGSNLFTKGTACSSCPSGHTQCTTSPAGLCSDGSSPNANPAPLDTTSASSQNGPNSGSSPNANPAPLDTTSASSQNAQQGRYVFFGWLLAWSSRN